MNTVVMWVSRPLSQNCFLWKGRALGIKDFLNAASALSLSLPPSLLPSLFSSLPSVCVLTGQGYQVLHLRYTLLELTNPFT